MKNNITFCFLLFFSVAFGQTNRTTKLTNNGTYTEFLHSFGKSIENKNTVEIKKGFLLLTNGKIVVEEDHEELYVDTEELCQEENIIQFGKRLQQTPKKVTDVTIIANRKAKHHFGLTIEKAVKVYLNTTSRKPHLNEVVLVLYKGKWFLVDY